MSLNDQININAKTDSKWNIKSNYVKLYLTFKYSILVVSTIEKVE